MAKQHWALVPSMFRTVGFGGAFFNGSCCAPCVRSDAFGLRCGMFIVCVKGADWGAMAFCSVLCRLVFRTVHRVFPHVPCTVLTRKQRPWPSNTGRWFCQFLVIYRCMAKGLRGGNVPPGTSHN